MSKKTIVIIALVLVIVCIVAAVVIFSGAKKQDQNNEVPLRKFTKTEVATALKDSKGMLTTEGPENDLTGFTYVIEGIYASKITEVYLQKAVLKLLTDPNSITYGELKSSYSFMAILNIYTLFDDKSEDDFDAYEFVDEITGIICNNETKSFDNWTISAKLDKEADKITINVTSK